jgi:hypothetical protein
MILFGLISSPSPRLNCLTQFLILRAQLFDLVPEPREITRLSLPVFPHRCRVTDTAFPLAVSPRASAFVNAQC